MTIPVFFTPEQSCSSNASFSPSAGKPALVMKDFLSNPNIESVIDVRSFRPASLLDLYSAHDSRYVDHVLDCKVPNGFGNYSPDVAKTLPYTVGSILRAAQHVVAYGGVAFSPTSGFHHAGHEYGVGFCTFNGLMVAAIRSKAKRVLILDYDQHYGDGTQDIIEHVRSSGANVDEQFRHITSSTSYTTGEQGLEVLGDELRSVSDYDLVLFQAGADIHVNDPLGGKMTTEQMLQRDQMVFAACNVAGVPLVWNLAGGYQRDKNGTIEPVLSLHRQTMLACIKEYT